MRPALRLVALALVLGGLTGCGDDSGTGSPGGAAARPGDPSRKEFCAAFNGLFDSHLWADTQADPAAMVAAVRGWAADIEDVGTPGGMPGDARRGFELFVDQAAQLDDDASLSDLQELGQDLRGRDRRDSEAFGDWAVDHCPLDLPGTS